MFSNRCSKSHMALIHGSPTLLSRMRMVRSGGMHKSESRLKRGFSIFCVSLSLDMELWYVARHSLSVLSTCSQYPCFGLVALRSAQIQMKGHFGKLKGSSQAHREEQNWSEATSDVVFRHELMFQLLTSIWS